jgi:hypothetical protein
MSIEKERDHILAPLFADSDKSSLIVIMFEEWVKGGWWSLKGGL